LTEPLGSIYTYVCELIYGDFQKNKKILKNKTRVYKRRVLAKKRKINGSNVNNS